MTACKDLNRQNRRFRPDSARFDPNLTRFRRLRPSKRRIPAHKHKCYIPRPRRVSTEKSKTMTATSNMSDLKNEFEERGYNTAWVETTVEVSAEKENLDDLLDVAEEILPEWMDVRQQDDGQHVRIVFAPPE